MASRLWLAGVLGTCPALANATPPATLDQDWEMAVEHVLQVATQAGPPERYEVALMTGDDQLDVVIVRHVGSGRRWSFDTPGHAWLHHPPRDLDGNGSTELLASTGTGGTCCPPHDAILGIVNGAATWVSFPESGFETGELQLEWDPHGTRLVRSDLDGQHTFRWNDGQIERIEYLPPLATLAQIEGSGERWQDGAPRTHTLAFDLDGDGEQERIECLESPRFGNLEACTLPVPGAAPQTLDYACTRLGVLSERSHGQHVLVCGALATLRFDGQGWR